MSVGCSMAGPHFSKDALHEIPDQLESQLSAVHERPKPTLP
jgi:hypothetical protein